MADLNKRVKDDMSYYTSPQLSAFPSLRHAFFNRSGGVSQGMYASLNFRMNSDDSPDSVRHNFAVGAGMVGAQLDQLACTRQQHTDTILIVDSAPGLDQRVSEEPVDALITAVPGICLTGFYADCQLVMLYSHKRRVAAVVHCGWRGVANEIVRKTIERMEEAFGCRPAELNVAVGPSICRRCFETDADVSETLSAVYGELIQEYIYRDQGKWHVDLKNITYSTLLRYGVMPYNIDISNQCTRCSTDKIFWSHRRHGEDRGVHAGMIVMR